MKNTKLPSAISILILTLLTVIVWISLSVYRALTTKPAPAVSNDVSQSLTPSLDSDSINKIESRTFLNDSQIPDSVTIAATPTPQGKLIPTPISTPIATQSASASPSATPSATP